MRIIRDKKGKAIEAELTKDEQLKLLKENNKRAKKFLQEQALQELTAQAQEMGMYGDSHPAIS